MIEPLIALALFSFFGGSMYLAQSQGVRAAFGGAIGPNVAGILRPWDRRGIGRRSGECAPRSRRGPGLSRGWGSG